MLLLEGLSLLSRKSISSEHSNRCFSVALTGPLLLNALVGYLDSKGGRSEGQDRDTYNGQNSMARIYGWLPLQNSAMFGAICAVLLGLSALLKVR